MTDRSIDDLGPVDHLIVEFPTGARDFTGDGAAELIKLRDGGIIRSMDVLITDKGEDGSVDVIELSDRPGLGEFTSHGERGRGSRSLISSRRR